MSGSPGAVWDGVFSRQDWGRYPQEEVVRFVARHFYAAGDRHAVRILDAGCGPGSGVWYLAREGFDAWGIDASEIAVAQAAARLQAEGLTADLRVGDLVHLEEIYEAQSFDAILDVTSTQHNDPDDIEAIYRSFHALLRPGGRVFAMIVMHGSWGSDAVSGTRTVPAVQDGPLRGKGLTHLADRRDIERFFAGFANVKVDISERTIDGGRNRYGHWVVEAVRPA